MHHLSCWETLNSRANHSLCDFNITHIDLPILLLVLISSLYSLTVLKRNKDTVSFVIGCQSYPDLLNLNTSNDNSADATVNCCTCAWIANTSSYLAFLLVLTTSSYTMAIFERNKYDRRCYWLSILLTNTILLIGLTDHQTELQIARNQIKHLEADAEQHKEEVINFVMPQCLHYFLNDNLC